LLRRNYSNETWIRKCDVVGPGILLLVAMPAVFGLPLGCVGLILRLCEWSWEKPTGSMGSTRILLAASLLCLPVAAYLAWGLIG
jgi:hypothetical protein